MSNSLGFWSIPFMFLTELGSWWGDKDVLLLSCETQGECPAGQGASTARRWEGLRPGCQGGGKRKMWMLFGNVGQGQEPKSEAKRVSLALLPTLFSLWPWKRGPLPMFFPFFYTTLGLQLFLPRGKFAHQVFQNWDLFNFRWLVGRMSCFNSHVDSLCFPFWLLGHVYIV